MYAVLLMYDVREKNMEVNPKQNIRPEWSASEQHAYDKAYSWEISILCLVGLGCKTTAVLRTTGIDHGYSHCCINNT